MNDVDITKAKACEQYVRRCRYSISIEKIDNAGLHAGSPMYFYCKDCGIPMEVLPEDYLFQPLKHCSQCQGLHQHGWIDHAKALYKEDN